MDVIIPFQHSENGDRELMYALRALEKNLINLDDVIVVGDRPVWDVNSSKLYVIEFPNRYVESHYAVRNVVNKIIRACVDTEIPKTGVLVSWDNSFLLAHVDAEDITCYHKGRTWHSGNTREANTRNLFEGQRINNYDCGALWGIIPAVFKEYITRDIDWNIPEGYCIKTVYAVRARVDGEFYFRDLYVKEQRAGSADTIIKAGDRYVNCSRAAFKYNVEPWLAEHFPNKSIFEA